MSNIRTLSLVGGLALGLFVPAVSVLALDLSVGTDLSVGSDRGNLSASAGVTANGSDNGTTGDMTDGTKPAQLAAANDPVVTLDGAIVGRVVETRSTESGTDRVVIRLMGDTGVEARQVSVRSDVGVATDGRFRLDMTRADLMAAVEGSVEARSNAATDQDEAEM